MIYLITEQKIDGTAYDDRHIGYFNRLKDAEIYVRNHSNSDFTYMISKISKLT